MNREDLEKFKKEECKKCKNKNSEKCEIRENIKGILVCKYKEEEK